MEKPFASARSPPWRFGRLNRQVRVPPAILSVVVIYATHKMSLFHHVSWAIRTVSESACFADCFRRCLAHVPCLSAKPKPAGTPKKHTLNKVLTEMLLQCSIPCVWGLCYFVGSPRGVLFRSGHSPGLSHRIAFSKQRLRAKCCYAPYTSTPVLIQTLQLVYKDQAQRRLRLQAGSLKVEAAMIEKLLCERGLPRK